MTLFFYWTREVPVSLCHQKVVLLQEVIPECSS